MTRAHGRGQAIEAGAIAPHVGASTPIGGSDEVVASLRAASALADPDRAAKSIGKHRAGFPDEQGSAR
jgi:hypothetical protein